MAVYKVPQDVEADDKLIGPFSFRQFIYLGIVAGGIGLGWVLGRLFLPLAIIPLPAILLFGALALPLRKDQPMETYLAAIVSFYLKPHKRLWDPDGQQSLIEITTPRVVEVQRTKDLSQMEAEQRLSYLASVVDSRGWAVRGVEAPEQSTSMNTDVYYEAQQAEDILDASGRTSHMIDNQLDRANVRRREELLARMQQPAPAPASSPVAPQTQAAPQPAIAMPYSNTTLAHLSINPYPTSMHQSVIQPLGSQPQQPPAPEPPQPAQPPSKPTVSPDIISLANNPDLSIETIAHEANRIKDKQGLPDDEVLISLH